MPAVTRLGDICTGHAHCYPPRPSTGASLTVRVNGIPAHRQSDGWASHGACPVHSPHGDSLAAGSPTVRVNNLQLGRIGDPVSCGSAVATGSSTVFANGR